MKKCTVIYNPHSGRREYGDTYKEKLGKILQENNYNVTFYTSKYKGAVTDILQSIDDDNDLVITIGGDGTFSEAMKGNFNREKKLVMAHLPTGTTNDIGKMYGYGKDLLRNIKLLMEGEIKDVDICTINDEPFVYVAGFGKFMNIPYETTRKSKKFLGYLAYVGKGFEEFINREKLYDLSYEVDGETYSGFYSLMFVSNSTRVAGFQSIFNDIKLDDNKFEVLFCNIKNKQYLLRSLLYLATNDIEHVPGFSYHKTNKIVIHNNSNKKIVWDIDGEKEEIDTEDIVIALDKTKMMVPKQKVKELFIKR